MLGGGWDARTIGQACRRGVAGHRVNLRVLTRQRLHTRAERQREKARSEVSVGNDAARAAKSGAVAPRVRVLRPGVFCPGEGRGRGASGRMCWAEFGGQSAIVPRSRMLESHQRKFTARSPLEVSDARPSRSWRLSASSWFSWYNRAHTRPASAHRHCRPGRWLAKSCLANATSVGKAPWLGNLKPTPSARARWLRHGRSRSARGGRCELDASPPIDGRAWAGSSLHTCEVLFGPPPVPDRATSGGAGPPFKKQKQTVFLTVT